MPPLRTVTPNGCFRDAKALQRSVSSANDTTILKSDPSYSIVLLSDSPSHITTIDPKLLVKAIAHNSEPIESYGDIPPTLQWTLIMNVYLAPLAFINE